MDKDCKCGGWGEWFWDERYWCTYCFKQLFPVYQRKDKSNG